MEHIKSYFNNLISNASLITIPIVSCFGYFTAYLFELESAKFYNISVYLIQIELLHVIFIAENIYLYLFLIANIIFELYNFITSFFKQTKRFSLSPKSSKKKMYQTWVLIVIVFFMYMLISPRFFAKYIEGEKDNFFTMVQKENKDYAVVKIYGDSAIALAVASESGTLTRDIYVFPKGQAFTGTLKYFDEIKIEK